MEFAAGMPLLRYPFTLTNPAPGANFLAAPVEQSPPRIRNPRRSGRMKLAAVIAFFCAGGGLTRYYLSGWVYGLLGRSFPYGTFAVNIIGAYLIGVVMELGLRSAMISDTLRIGLTVGFMGGLTTFSTFSYETFKLLEDGQFLVAFTNVIFSVIVCLLFTWLGILSIRSVT
jgi:fluoride exporter